MEEDTFSGVAGQTRLSFVHIYVVTTMERCGIIGFYFPWKVRWQQHGAPNKARSLFAVICGTILPQHVILRVVHNAPTYRGAASFTVGGTTVGLRRT